jgi:peroxiredoxin
VPKLAKIYTALKDKGFVIIGVHTTEESENMKAFVEKQKMDWPVVVDAKGAKADDKTSEAYGVSAWPTMVLIDTDGKIVETYIGSHPSKEEIEKLLKKDDKKKDDEKKSDEKKEEK